MTSKLRALLGLHKFALPTVMVLAHLILIVPANAALNLVTNGSFETTDAGLASPGGYICKNSGNTTCTSNVTNWTSTCHANCGISTTAASILFGGTNGSAFNTFGLRGTVPNSPDGGKFIAIDGDGQYNASISQTINGLVVGINYSLQFYQAAAQQTGTSGATTERWQVNFGSDMLLSTLMNNPDGGVQPWTLQTMTFKASAVSETLTFLAIGTPAGGPPVVLLDGVSLVAPEPGTFALFAVGTVVLLAMRKRG